MSDIKLMELMIPERTNTFFRDYNITRIKIAFIIKSYLDPDEACPPLNLDQEVMTAFLSKDFEKAISLLNWDTGSSCWDGTITKEAVEMAAILYDNFIKNKAKAKDKRRVELLKELKELEGEL